MTEASEARCHELAIRVRYCECDPMGVAHHSVYPVWFEMGRTELLRESGVSYRELEDAGVMLAVVSLQMKYRSPARYDDLMTLHTTLESVGHVKIEHSYSLQREGVELARATSTLACLGRDGRPREVPAVLQAEP